MNKCETCGWTNGAHHKLTHDFHALSDRLAKVEAALREVLSTMEMQEKRETGEFHINQPTAKFLWDGAKDKAKEALASAEGRPVCATCHGNGQSGVRCPDCPPREAAIDSPAPKSCLLRLWCGTDDGSMFPRANGDEHFRSVTGHYYCTIQCLRNSEPPAPQPEAPAGFNVVGRSGPGVPQTPGTWVRRARDMRDGTAANGEPRQLRNYNLGGVWDNGEYDILEPLPAEPSSDAGHACSADLRCMRGCIFAPSEPGKGYCSRCKENVVIDGHRCPPWRGVCKCNDGDPVFHTHYREEPHGCARCGKCDAFQSKPSEPAKCSHYFGQRLCEVCGMRWYSEEPTRPTVVSHPVVRAGEPAKAPSIAERNFQPVVSGATAPTNAEIEASWKRDHEPDKAPLSERILRELSSEDDMPTWRILVSDLAGEVADLERRLAEEKKKRWEAEDIQVELTEERDDLTNRLAATEKERDEAIKDSHWAEQEEIREHENALVWKSRAEEAEKARDELRDKAEWWMKKCAEVEQERDKRERATCLSDERVKEAVLAERARVNGWWLVWWHERLDAREREKGIASGAPVPGGGK